MSTIQMSISIEQATFEYEKRRIAQLYKNVAWVNAREEEARNGGLPDEASGYMIFLCYDPMQAVYPYDENCHYAVGATHNATPFASVEDADITRNEFFPHTRDRLEILPTLAYCKLVRNLAEREINRLEQAFCKDRGIAERPL